MTMQDSKLGGNLKVKSVYLKLPIGVFFTIMLKKHPKKTSATECTDVCSNLMSLTRYATLRSCNVGVIGRDANILKGFYSCSKSLQICTKSD
jgi:hypothetical protein